MAFRSLNADAVARFNSTNSAKFIDAYDKFVCDKIVKERSRTPHTTFAPSQLRCNRRSWFRIRGVAPDTMPNPDRALQFTADIGTAIHRLVQSNLQEIYGDCWVPLEDYMKLLNPEYTYTCTPAPDSLEYFLDIEKPPVRCAVDGILKIDNEYYLFELKTIEGSSFQDLTGPKQEHIDQLYAYSTLLNLTHVLIVYVDRQYGGMKCYELKIPEYIHRETWERMDYVMEMVDKNLAPEGLPSGDKWCTPNYCPYYKKCKEYGR
jgi:hypothetical protein